MLIFLLFFYYKSTHMNTQKIPTHYTPTATHDEHILVVKRTALFPDGAWQGLKHIDPAQYLTLIDQEKEFLPRSLMEVDPTYKQIIPYLVFTHKNRYFLMRRQSKASEQRLKDKYSLGIGGHIRQEDMTSSSIIQWAQREFEEEVDYHGAYTVEPLGIINDDSNAVGQVHLGLVLLLHGTTDTISVKSELKSGELLHLDQCTHYYQDCEPWTQMILDALPSCS